MVVKIMIPYLGRIIGTVLGVYGDNGEETTILGLYIYVYIYIYVFNPFLGTLNTSIIGIQKGAIILTTPPLSFGAFSYYYPRLVLPEIRFAGTGALAVDA